MQYRQCRAVTEAIIDAGSCNVLEVNCNVHNFEGTTRGNYKDWSRQNVEQLLMANNQLLAFILKA